MTLQFNAIAMLLVVLIILGLLSHNSPITIAAAFLLIMQQTLLIKYIDLVEKYGLKIGIIVLTIGVLAPIVSGKIQIHSVAQFVNLKMLLAILVGVFVAWLAGRGVPVMTKHPTVVTGLIVGTIIGVALLGGIPVGPLIAAGILSLFIGK